MVIRVRYNGRIPGDGNYQRRDKEYNNRRKQDDLEDYSVENHGEDTVYREEIDYEQDMDCLDMDYHNGDYQDMEHWYEDMHEQDDMDDIYERKKEHEHHRKPMWCTNQAPYPERMVEKPNRFYARLLMDDYAGRGSELTAITQYLYHYHLLMDTYPDVADLLECISMVEMTHMEFIAEVIIKLGGEPKYGTKMHQHIEWWKGSFVYYGQDICDMLTADIEGEKQAVAHYQQLIETIDDRHIKNLLSRIRKDEQEHIRLLTEKINMYCKNCR